MPWDNTAQLHESVLQSLCPAEKPHSEKPTRCNQRAAPTCCNDRKPGCSGEHPVQPKINQ